MPTRFSPQYREAFVQELSQTLDELPHVVPEQTGVKFEPHQQKINREILREIEQQQKSMLCAVACCGSGKTPIEVGLVAASQRAKKRLEIDGERKDIVIAPERLVVYGIQDEFSRIGLETGLLVEGRRELDKPIIIATVQALQASLARKRLFSILPPGTIDLAIFDEADLFLTEKRHEKLIPTLDPRIRIGFTATPKWPDGRRISEAFGRQVSELKLREGISSEINAEPDYYLYEAHLDESKLKIRNQDYDPAILAAGMKQAELHLALPEIYEHLVPENRRHDWPTLIYVPGVKLASATAETFNRLFPDITTLAVTGKTSSRGMIKDIRSRFADRDIQVLVFCEMGARGMNLENATVLIDGYPTLSLNKLEQRHGRVLRKIREGSPLWEKGWRKDQAIIAQIIPKSNRFRRPALFTDIIRQEELLTLHARKRSRSSEGGAPLSKLIDEVRRHIEGQKPSHYADLVEHLKVIEEIRRIEELPHVDNSGFFRIPRRYKHD